MYYPHIIELLFALVALVFICLVSQHYFTFNSDEISGNVNAWKKVRENKMSAPSSQGDDVISQELHE